MMNRKALLQYLNMLNSSVGGPLFQHAASAAGLTGSDEEEEEDDEAWKA